jgi:hypothetical protein
MVQTYQSHPPHPSQVFFIYKQLAGEKGFAWRSPG